MTISVSCHDSWASSAPLQLLTPWSRPRGNLTNFSWAAAQRTRSRRASPPRSPPRPRRRMRGSLSLSPPADSPCPAPLIGRDLSRDPDTGLWLVHHPQCGGRNSGWVYPWQVARVSGGSGAVSSGGRAWCRARLMRRYGSETDSWCCYCWSPAPPSHWELTLFLGQVSKSLKSEPKIVLNTMTEENQFLFWIFTKTRYQIKAIYVC